MSFISKGLVPAVAPVVAGLSVASAAAHDLHNLAHPSNTGPDAVLSTLGPSTADQATRSIIVNSSKWPLGYTLKVCFYEGGPQARQAIAAEAQKWLAGVNLKMDFGAAPALRTCAAQAGPNNLYEDIRISFRGAGHWSFIGVDGHRWTGPTMNLQNYDVLPALDGYSKAVVIHEFGHALGLHHEHQSPGSPCDGEFNLPAVKQLTGWNDQQIKTNFAMLERNSSVYTWGPYDPTSVMMYSLPIQVLYKGAQSKCWVQQNYQISSDDRSSLRQAYPGIPSASAAQRTRSADSVVANSALPAEVRNRAWIQKLLVEGGQ